MEWHGIVAIAVMTLVVTIQFGREAAVTCVAITATLAWTYFEHQAHVTRGTDAKKKFRISDIVHDNEEIGGRHNTPVTQEALQSLTIPQDAPYQIPVVDVEYVHIPKHRIILGCVAKLSAVKRRRPASLSVALATIERFLELYDFLMGKKLRRIGNSAKHERAKQRISNMSMLRTEALEQMQSIAFEFTHSHADLQEAIVHIRDYTHALLLDVVRRYRETLPGIGNGMPPYGVVPYSARDAQHKSSMYRM